MNLTAIQSKVTRGNYVNVKKSVILSAEKEQPAENKVTGQQSEVTRPVHTIVSDSSAANPVRDKLQSESEQIQDDGVKDLFQQMVKSYKNLNLHLVEYGEECKETEAAKDGDQNKNNIINVDRKVILSMKQSQEYAERVNHILQNANEVTSGFIEDCIQHAKELSDDETICTVGKIETKLIDDGGKPALVTSVHFEYTSKHSDEVREHRWDGNVKNLKKEYIQKIAEKFEDRVEELLRDREEI